MTFFVCEMKKFSSCLLLLLRWKVGLDPIVPPSLEGVDLLISLVHELERHPGAGPLIKSGTVKNEDLVFRILWRP